MLEPGGFSAIPEIDAIIQQHRPIALDRAKEIVREIVAGLGTILPITVAQIDAVRAVERLRRTVEEVTETVASADEIVLAKRRQFVTPNHEIAHRASRIAREIIVERSLMTDEELGAIAAECYERARREMGDRAARVTVEGQDVAPVVLLRIRQCLEAMGALSHAMQPLTALLKRSLDLGLLPFPSSNRPSLDLAMFFAWLLQDVSTPRGMTDAHVVVFLEESFTVLPPEWARLTPKHASVRNWRLERAKHPEIPRLTGSKKSK